MNECVYRMSEKAGKLSESSKAILCTKERIERAKRETLQVVEQLLENSVTKSEFIEACKSLSQDDYFDVIEERNVLNLCGYPICSKKIKISSQKYHISCKLNKVYDLTERKCFCSNVCYKASKFVQAQLFDEPVWVHEEPVAVSLLSSKINKGSSGDEVQLVVTRITETEIEAEVNNQNQRTFDSGQMLCEAVEQCSSQLENLIVSERNGLSHIRSIFIEDEGSNCNRKCYESNEYNEKSMDSDDDDEVLPPLFENEKHSFHKCMPVVSSSKPRSSILIEPLPQKVENSVTVAKGRGLDFVKSIFHQWMTIDSLKYLFGEVNVSIAESAPSVNPEACQSEQESIENKYGELCLKLDKQEREETEMDEEILKRNISVIATKKSSIGSLTKELFHNDATGNKNPVEAEKGIRPKRRTHKKRDNSEGVKPRKSVTFDPSVKEEISKDTASKVVESLPEPVLPLVDSLSQDVLRQQIVSERLKVIFVNLLPSIGLYYRSICSDLRDFIVTFKLSSNNVTFRPNEWKLIALVLLRMLVNKTSVSCDDSKFNKLLEKSLFSGFVSLLEIDALIESLRVRDNSKNS